MLRRLAGGGLVCLLMCGTLLAETLPAVPNARNVMALVDANLSPADEVSVAALLLIHPNGQQRRWRIKTFYQRAPENNMGAVLLRFLEPNDLRGMTLVSINQPEGENYQWLYLPAFRNPKILSESAKSDYIFGSDLTFEDFVPFVLDAYAFETVREESLEGRPAQVIRVTPMAEPIKTRAAYDHQLLWVDTERMVLLRADYFDAVGRLFKTSTWSDFYRPDGRHWRARRRAVFSPLRPHWTELTFEDIEIDRGLPVDFFSEENVTSLR